MNTLELKKHNSGSFETTMLCNGATNWELHPSYLDEIKILEKIRDVNFYQKLQGEWTLKMPDDYRIFRDISFEKVITMAISYINDRDHPRWEDHF